jgi:hypothetical protein
VLLSLPLRSSNSKSFFPLECFLHSRTQQLAEHLCERLIFVRRQVLRDVAQNVSFAGIILDKYRAKKQVIHAMLDRDVVGGIPPNTTSIYSCFGCSSGNSSIIEIRSAVGSVFIWRVPLKVCSLCNTSRLITFLCNKIEHHFSESHVCRKIRYLR